MPRKLIDLWAIKIRNAYVTAINFFIVVTRYKKNFDWGPTVNKEIGINYTLIAFCMLVILSNKSLLFNSFSKNSLGVK